MFWLHAAVQALLETEPSVDPERLVAAIEDAFQDPFKAARLDGFFLHGAQTHVVERLATSGFPGSLRLRLPGDACATLLCLPAKRVAYVTHLFLKDHDPGYDAAVRLHDARLQAARLPSLADDAA